MVIPSMCIKIKSIIIFHLYHQPEKNMRLEHFHVKSYSVNSLKNTQLKSQKDQLPLELRFCDSVRLLWKRNFLLHFGKGVSLFPSHEML